jgi:hypothetical protein
MNLSSVRSKLKWFRFFRWGASREREAEDASGSEKGVRTFLKGSGWEVMRREVDKRGAAKQRAAASTPNAATSDIGMTDQAASSPALPPIDPSEEIHPISRNHLSYGRYHVPPMVDATTRPDKPPMLLEQYLLRAQLRERKR